MTDQPTAPLTPRERMTTYRIRKAKREAAERRAYSRAIRALRRIASEVTTLKEAREVAEWTLLDAG